MLRKARHQFKKAQTNKKKPNNFFRRLTFSEHCSSHHSLTTRSVQLIKTGRTHKDLLFNVTFTCPTGKEDFADGVKANRAPLKCHSTSDSDTAINITSLSAQQRSFWEHHSCVLQSTFHMVLRLNII